LTIAIAKRVQARILRYLVNSVISHVIQRKRHLLAQRLLQFQIPLLVARILDPVRHRINGGRRESGHAVLNARERTTVREPSLERRVALGSQLRLVSGNCRRKTTTGNVEASLQRRITQQQVGDSAREGIREQPKSTPNDRVLKAKGRPGETKARQPLDRRVVRQDLVQARDNRLVVGLVYVVRDIEEVSTQPCKTVGLTYWVGEVLTSQREGQF